MNVYFFRYNDVNVLISITAELLDIKLWNWESIFSRPRHIIRDRKISSNKSRDKFVIDHVRFSIFKIYFLFIHMDQTFFQTVSLNYRPMKKVSLIFVKGEIRFCEYFIKSTLYSCIHPVFTNKFQVCTLPYIEPYARCLIYTKI